MPRDPNEIREWTIYKIVNPSGRVYLGKTYNFENRIRQYKNNAHNQHFVNRSIKKHGFVNHKIDIIEKFFGNVKYADDKEMFWIRSYMSNVCKYPEMNGMNLTDGGEGSIGYKQSEERRKKVSEQMKGNKWNVGRKQSKERVESRASKIRGKKVSEERRKRLTESNIRLRGQSIIVIDLLENKEFEFRTIREAAKFTEINRNTISFHLRNMVKTKPYFKNRKYKFKYKKDVIHS